MSDPLSTTHIHMRDNNPVITEVILSPNDNTAQVKINWNGIHKIAKIEASSLKERDSLVKKIVDAANSILDLEVPLIIPNIHEHEFIIVKDKQYTNAEVTKKANEEEKAGEVGKVGVFQSVCNLVKKLGIPVSAKSENNTAPQPSQQQSTKVNDHNQANKPAVDQQPKNETPAKTDPVSSNKDKENQTPTNPTHTKQTEPTHSNNLSAKSNSATAVPAGVAPSTTPAHKNSVENPTTRGRRGAEAPKEVAKTRNSVPKKTQKTKVPSKPLAPQETQSKAAKKKSSLKKENKEDE